MNSPGTNDFERAILLRIADENPSITLALKAVLPSLGVVEREYTSAGSFTTFSTGGANPELTAKTYDLQSHYIKLPQLQMGLDAVLFRDYGKPDFLNSSRSATNLGTAIPKA